MREGGDDRWRQPPEPVLPAVVEALARGGDEGEATRAREGEVEEEEAVVVRHEDDRRESEGREGGGAVKKRWQSTHTRDGTGCVGAGGEVVEEDDEDEDEAVVL